MKKILLFAIIAMASVGAISAQKGKSAIGLNIGVSPNLDGPGSIINKDYPIGNHSYPNIGVGIKYQYGITNAIRVEADVEYWFKGNNYRMFDAAANIHYLFNASERFRFYPLLGVGFAGLTVNEWHKTPEYTEYGKWDYNKFFANVGAGAEYSLSKKISLGLEVKYQYVNEFHDLTRLPVTLGFTYTF